MAFNLRYHIPINTLCPAVSILYLATSMQNLLLLASKFAIDFFVCDLKPDILFRVSF